MILRMELLNALIIVSEKAANIARTIRENEHLFELLVQKKEQSEANPRFVEDFKTLADVLIQEMVKHDISEKFPNLSGSIRGEENNTFSNKLGKTICIELKNNCSETVDLLKEVLAGDEEAATILAAEAHRDMCFQDVNTTPLPNEDIVLPLEDCAIWIDPIDSTAEYINGIERLSEDGVPISGLKCATVLIGVYNKRTQQPIMGVINQPFATCANTRWSGYCIWGVCTESSRLSWIKVAIPRNNTIVLSSSEHPDIKDKLRSKFKLVEAAGVGYKILTVLKGAADAYIISKNSTYKWDSCGPHAIIRSLGGEILNFRELASGNSAPVNYCSDNDKHNNEGGLVAYRNGEILEEIIQCFS